MVLSIMITKNRFFQRNIPMIKARVQTDHIPFEIEMAKIGTLTLTKMSKKAIPLRPHILI